MLRSVIGGLFAASFVAVSASAQAGAKFTLSSSDVHAGQAMAMAQVFNGMGCTGSNKSPAMQWQGAPAGTKSFALTVYDPDAPTGSGWWHWVIYNIPAGTTKLASGSVPAGAVQGNTDFGTSGYGGPCPPVGDKPHHYIFTVYALNVDKLDVPASATAAYVGFNIHGHMIGSATLTALYGH